MSSKLELLRMSDIHPNPLNNRSMTESEIENIKDSILEVGLLHPLTVYEDTPGFYIIVSGHKRFDALKLLGRGNSTVQCTVIDKPGNPSEEMELMARANVHRSNPEQIQNECAIVNNLWNTMPAQRRSKLTEKYRKAFIKANETDPLYIKDPAAFMSNRFRARCEYINHITGLGLSNKTISKYLKDILKGESEEIPEEKKPVRVRTITASMIIKSIQSLSGLIDSFDQAHSPGFMPDEVKDLLPVLETAENALKNM